ncbi:predicted protein [Brucella sp. 83/13]|nr:predicted protein [Brucella sp. 83/13]
MGMIQRLASKSIKTPISPRNCGLFLGMGIFSPCKCAGWEVYMKKQVGVEPVKTWFSGSIAVLQGLACCR